MTNLLHPDTLRNTLRGIYGKEYNRFVEIREGTQEFARDMYYIYPKITLLCKYGTEVTMQKVYSGYMNVEVVTK